MQQVKKAARLLEQAERPVIIAGQGVLLSGAWDELRAFAEHTNIPVITTLLGISGFPESHPLSLGFLGMHGWVHCNYAVHHADLVISIGMRMDDRACGKFSGFAPQARDRPHRHRPGRDRQERARRRADRGRRRRACCAGSTPEVEAARSAATTRPGCAQIDGWRSEFPPKRYPPTTPELYQPQVHPGALSSRRAARRSSSPTSASTRCSPRSTISTTSRTRGSPRAAWARWATALPAAIGAQMARPDKQVWCVVGDGCFQMTHAGAGRAVVAARAGQDRAAEQRVPGHGAPAAAGAVPRQPGRGRPGRRAGLRQAGAGVWHPGLAGDAAGRS